MKQFCVVDRELTLAVPIEEFAKNVREKVESDKIAACLPGECATVTDLTSVASSTGEFQIYTRRYKSQSLPTVTPMQEEVERFIHSNAETPGVTETMDIDMKDTDLENSKLGTYSFNQETSAMLILKRFQPVIFTDDLPSNEDIQNNVIPALN